MSEKYFVKLCEKRSTITKQKNIIAINQRQAGAELGQAQVIIEVLVEVGVTLMLKL